jgi:hypothetical protein
LDRVIADVGVDPAEATFPDAAARRVLDTVE